MHPDILKTRKRLIVHADCADGIASAMIIRDVLPDIEVVEVQYGTEQHRTLGCRLGDIYCDFSPQVPSTGRSYHARASCSRGGDSGVESCSRREETKSDGTS